MRRLFALTLALCLFAALPAWASQNDEPPPPDQGNEDPAAENDAFFAGMYLSAGKALRFYDFNRLNHSLAAGGVDPFTGMIDDWNFELAFIAPTYMEFGLNGGFWNQETGGSLVSAEIEGFEIYAFWGKALLSRFNMWLSPNFGIGYNQQKLTLRGNPAATGFSDMPRSGSAVMDQQGLFLQLGMRVEYLDIVPEDSPSGFLIAHAFTFGWKGVPLATDWNRDGDTIQELPNDMIHAFFISYNLGFGFAARGEQLRPDFD